MKKSGVYITSQMLQTGILLRQCKKKKKSSTKGNQGPIQGQPRLSQNEDAPNKKLNNNQLFITLYKRYFPPYSLRRHQEGHCRDSASPAQPGAHLLVWEQGPGTMGCFLSTSFQLSSVHFLLTCLSSRFFPTYSA